MSKTYFFIYRTTNLINGKFYIGKHVTKRIDDGYLGSGVALKAAIKKYGRENFKREILLECCSPEELNEQEKSIVTKDFVASPSTYNLTVGGSGGGGNAEHFFRNCTPSENARKAANTILNRPDVLSARNSKISEKTKQRYTTKPESFIGGISNLGKRKETDEGIQKQIASRKIYTDNMHAQWLENVKDGINKQLNAKQIAETYNMSLSTVYRVIRKVNERKMIK